MQPERWKQVEALFEAAQQQPAEQRGEFLRRACGADEELRAEVESLLKAAESRDPLLDGSPLSSIAERPPALKPGDKLGNFQVVALIGRGGMGEVYRARDVRLKRDVAIKTLPPGFAGDRDRIARFEREARAASALNHPNIVSVYDIGTEGGVSFIVSELVDGETLADVIQRGPLPLRKLIEVSTQICDGLAAAHAAGVIHRDLKPGNIMLTRDGRVKILDFGLARQDRAQGVDSTTMDASHPGLIMGTPGYMSPEQVRGEPTDARSDIFSVGVILYEMASGKRAFSGGSSVEVMNAVLKDEPPELPLASPPALDRIVRRCIEKQPARRFQSAADLGFALSSLAASPKPEERPKSRAWLKWAALLTACVIAAALWWAAQRAVPEKQVVTLTSVPLTAATGFEDFTSFSPDGSQVAYVWDEGKGGYDSAHIYVKVIREGKPVQLTSGPEPDSFPAWSPDGRTIAFCRSLGDACRIYTMPALGGAQRKIAEGRFGGRMSWSPDSRFLAVSELGPKADSASLSLIRVETGDRLAALTKPTRSKTSDQDPVFSPDGRLLLFTRCERDFRCGLFLLNLTTDYLPSGDPRLLRQENGGIDGSAWARDGKELIYALSGDAGMNYHLMRIRAQAGSLPERLALTGERASSPAVAPRGNRLAYTHGLFETHIWQVRPGKPARTFTSSTRLEFSPQYSPDGQRVAFSSDRTGLHQIWICEGDGENPLQLTHFDLGHSGTPRWSPDGRWIAFDHQEEDGWRIYVMASDGGQLRKLAEDEVDANLPSWSRDGKWIYYASNRTGRYEVWRREAQGGKAIQLTHNGGWVALESHDGQSLYYTKLGNDPGLWVLPLKGGEEKQILKSVGFEEFEVMDDGIYYIPGAQGETSVRFHSFATAQDKEIAPIKDPGQGLAVSPDRNKVLFTTGGGGANVMVVDNFR